MYLIAEIGQAHEGSLGIAHSYIDAVAATGVHAIKFQTHIAAAESSIHEPFRVNFSYEDKTRFDYWKRMEFTVEQWKGIKEHCEKVGLEFISSPFSMAAVDLLENLGVNKYKIGSGEVNNYLMLERIAKTGKPILLSSGMSSFSELEKAVELIKQYNNELTIFQCTTSYPTPPERLGLNVITEMKQRFPFAQIGLSEHTGEIYAGIAAAALGADVLEFHVVFDKRMFGPDARSSLTIDQVKELVKGVLFINKSISHPIDKNDLSNYTELKKIFEKSLAINKTLPKGHIVSLADLEAKKPAQMGINASSFREVLGKKLTRDFNQWEFLTEKDLL